MTRVVRGLLSPGLLGRVLAAFDRANDWERMAGANVYGPAHQQFTGRGMPVDGEPYWMDFDRSTTLTSG